MTEPNPFSASDTSFRAPAEEGLWAACWRLFTERPVMFAGVAVLAWMSNAVIDVGGELARLSPLGSLGAGCLIGLLLLPIYQLVSLEGVNVLRGRVTTPEQRMAVATDPGIVLAYAGSMVVVIPLLFCCLAPGMIAATVLFVWPLAMAAEQCSVTEAWERTRAAWAVQNPLRQLWVQLVLLGLLSTVLLFAQIVVESLPYVALLASWAGDGVPFEEAMERLDALPATPRVLVTAQLLGFLPSIVESLVTYLAAIVLYVRATDA